MSDVVKTLRSEMAALERELLADARYVKVQRIKELLAAYSPEKETTPTPIGGGKRRVETREVVNLHGLPVALPAERPAIEKHGFQVFRSLETARFCAFIHELYVLCREQAGRAASPTVAIIDSQSVKSTEKGGGVDRSVRL